MTFLILNTDYPEFLQWLYAAHPGLETRSFDDQMRARNETFFGVADFYSTNLRALGHEAYDIHANNESLQAAWAREHRVRVAEPFITARRVSSLFPRARRRAAWTSVGFLQRAISRMLPSPGAQGRWFFDILEAQVRYYSPDVLLNQSMRDIGCQFLRQVKPYVRLIVGQHAATPLSDTEDYRCYDLIVTSFLPTSERLRKQGVCAELHRLGFEPRVLSSLEKNGARPFDVTFVGSFHHAHKSRTALLETLCAQVPQITIWSPGIQHLSPKSPIVKSYAGQAWGRDMYGILSQSKVTLNHHGDVPPYANNCRLYEATGVNTLLITDWKENLEEIFAAGKEVIAYRTVEECAELIRYYLQHDEEREAISLSGQQRTLREHTYYQRMQELVDCVSQYL